MTATLMQARDSQTGELVTWVHDPADFAGAFYPGPGSPEFIAANGIPPEAATGNFLPPFVGAKKLLATNGTNDAAEWDDPPPIALQSVANLAALTALPTTLLVQGALAFVRTLRAYFSLDKVNDPTEDGITVVLGATSAKWVRLDMAHLSWAEQTAWYIDPAAGNDENVGSLASPVKTSSEIRRRWGSNLLNDAIDVRYVGTTNPGVADPITASRIYLGPNAQLTFYGVRTVARTGTFSAVTNLNRATSQAFEATDATMPGAWTADLGRVIRLTSGGSVGARTFAAKDLGSKTARLGPWKQLPSPGGVLPVAAAASATDTYAVETCTQVYMDDIQAFCSFGTGFPSINFVDLDFQNLGGDTLPPILPSAIVTFIGCSFRTQPVPMAAQNIYFIGCYLENGIFAQNGAYAFVTGSTVKGGLEIISTSGSILVFDFDTLVQSGGIVASAGDVQLGTVGIFDAAITGRNPRGAGVQVGGVTLGRGGAIVTTINDSTNALYGSGNAGPGVAVDAGGSFVYDNLPTVHGIGGDSQLSGASVARAWNNAAGKYLPNGINLTWLLLSTAISAGGFGGAADDPQTGASISAAAGLDAGVSPHIVTATDHTWSFGEEVIEFSAFTKTLTLPDPGLYLGQQITCIAKVEAGTGVVTPGNEFTINAGTKTINGSATYVQKTKSEVITVKWNGTEWRLV